MHKIKTLSAAVAFMMLAAGAQAQQAARKPPPAPRGAAKPAGRGAGEKTALPRNAKPGDGVKALATLPSLDELRAKLAGIINQPATKLATIVSAPGSSLARALIA